MTGTKNYILNQSVAEKKLVLVGIRESGSVVARCIQKMLAEFSTVETELITMSLDKRLPREIVLSKKIDFNDKTIIIIDDVANSGKTLLYALKPFLEFHPKKIQTLVLVERSHNNFPVRPDYIGLSIATTLQEHIFVEVDGEKVMGAYME